MKQLIATPLLSLLSDLLHGHSDVPISQDTAESIYLLTKNKHTCYVQFPGEDAVDIQGRLIIQPHLWAWNHWISTSERSLRAKIRSEKLADERAIFNANIDRLQRRILRELPLEPTQAHVLARKIVLNNLTAKARFFGVNKFYTDIKEIP